MSHTLQNKILVPFRGVFLKFALSKVSMILMGRLHWRGQPWIYDNHCFKQEGLGLYFYTWNL